MNWRMGIENKQVREFCAAYFQPVVQCATELMETALDEGADAVEVTTASVRFRVGGEWQEADRIPAHVVPAVCALMLLMHTSDRQEGTVASSQNGESRQIRIDAKALKLSLVIK
jgi:type II secretory ATPase GspE/PulE/Tfp pilus assembly ATPase PilB-like protein